MMRPKVTKKASPTKPEPTIPGFQSLAIASPTSPTAVVDPFGEEDVVTEPRPRHVSGVSSDSVSSGEDVSEMIDEGVTVTELDMGHLVSKETLAAFKDQVETRKRKRNRKLRDEKRREKKIQHEEARLMGFPGRYVRVESDYYSSSSSVQSGADHFP